MAELVSRKTIDAIKDIERRETLQAWIDAIRAQVPIDDVLALRILSMWQGGSSGLMAYAEGELCAFGPDVHAVGLATLSVLAQMYGVGTFRDYGIGVR